MNKIKFEAWNKKWNRYATEDEVKKYVRIEYNGIGFVNSVSVLTSEDIELKYYHGEEKILIEENPPINKGLTKKTNSFAKPKRE